MPQPYTLSSELATSLRRWSNIDYWHAECEHLYVLFIYKLIDSLFIYKLIDSLCEMKKKEELAELLHKAEIEKTARESGNMQSEESEHSEITTADSVGETYTKQTGTGQSQHSSAQKSNAETSKLTGKPEAEQTKQTDVDGTESSDLADKGSGSEETYAYRFIAMEHCLADFIMLQKDISDLKTRLNVRIIYNCGKIIVFGDREEQLKEALRKITSLAEASYVDFILKTNPFKKDSDEWQAIEKEANVSNVAISIRSIEHKPLRDKEYYKVGKVEICVGHGCIGDIKRVDMIVLPVNRFFFPITPASELFFNKGKNWNLSIFNSSVSVARH